MSNTENASNHENSGPQENHQNHDKVAGQHVNKPSQAEGDSEQG